VRLPLPVTTLLFVACGLAEPPPCVSPCGVWVHGSTDCQSYEVAEQKIIGSFEGLAPELCSSLSGWSVSIIPDETWVDQWVNGERVAGRTWCLHGSVQVSGPRLLGALAHELGHVSQCPVEDVDHELWETSGIARAVEAAIHAD
jgi:hypothetical protein